jgi:diguanylate cyclase (GGDEF)-like protein
MFVLARVIAWLTICWYMYLGDMPGSAQTVFKVIAGTYAAHLVLLLVAVKGKCDIKLAFLSSIIYDILMIPLLVACSGGALSSFFLLYLITISGAVYVLRFYYALSAAILLALGYVLALQIDPRSQSLFDVVLRAGLGMAYFLALSYASDHVRRSERRVLNLFDTLNRRTSELEKSQLQLQTIYENTRALASILDAPGVLREVVRLLDNLLQLNCFGVIMPREDGGLQYVARVHRHDRDLESEIISPEQMELVHMVWEGAEPIRIKDITGRTDYKPMFDTTRSVMIVPMVARAQVSGVLTAESSAEKAFTERDMQMLSVVARSAALALDNAILHQKMEELTIIDGLTETYNYRYFKAKLEEERRRSFRYDLPMSLVMVDIDWFKSLNDNYGHENGNRVLKQLSQIIKTCIRDVDTFARYGGEEFAIILPQTGLDEAQIMGERIRHSVESSDFKLAGDATVRITVSVGISCFPENGQGPKQLVRVADEALYRAKGEGRNLVRCI